MADEDAGSDQDDGQERKPSYLIKYNDAKKAVPFLFRDGQGTATFLNKDTYVGEYKYGKRHGKGTYTWTKTGAKYEGDYVAGLRNGVGTMTYPNGATYSGEWLRNQRHGQGTYRYPNGDLYCGAWDHDTKSGQGTYLVSANKTQITGEWVSGKCLNGTWEFYDGKPFFGVFTANKVQSYSALKDEVDKFHAAFQKDLIQSRANVLQRVFDVLDDDPRNGWLSVGELHAFCKLVDPAVSVDRLFGNIDSNHDRRIDRREFLAFGVKFANATAGAAMGGNTDQFTLAMRLALAARLWLKKSAAKQELKWQQQQQRLNAGGPKPMAAAAGDANDEKSAAPAVQQISFTANSQLAQDVDAKTLARVDAICRAVASEASDFQTFDKTAVKAFLMAMNDDIKDIDAFAEASMKKWGSTPAGFAETLLQSTIDQKEDTASGKPSLVDTAELALSRVQAANGVLTAQVQSRIDTAVRFVTSDTNANAFDLTRVRAWVNEIEDDIAGDADVAQLITKIFGADPRAFKTTLTEEVLKQKSLSHLEQVETIIAALRKKLALPGVSGTLIDASVLARIDNVVGLVAADPPQPSVSLAVLLAPAPAASSSSAAAAAAAASAGKAAAAAGAGDKKDVKGGAEDKDDMPPPMERRAFNPVAATAWICEFDEDIGSNPDTAFDEFQREWGKDPKEFGTALLRRLETSRSLEALEQAERAAASVRQKLKIPTEEEKQRARDKQRQLERDETDEDDSTFPDMVGADWTDSFTLWVAARVGSIAGLARLLAAVGAQAGLVVNAKDGNGFTPLYYALLCGHIRASKLLLEKGALWDYKCYLAASKLSLKNLLKTQYTRQRVVEGSKAKPKHEDDDE